MDSKEFKLYVRKVLLDNGFNEHSNPTCYLKDMGDYYLRCYIDKSTWSDSYGVFYEVYLKKFFEYNSLIKAKAPFDFSIEARYDGIGAWFDLDKYTTAELKHYISIAINELLEKFEKAGITGLFAEYPYRFTIFHKEYIAEHYGKKE